jgi:polyisoprenoid-binding protein YceI
MKIGLRGWKRWLLVGGLGVGALVGGGPFIYIHFIEGKAPAPLTLPSVASTQASNASTSADGTWTVAGGSRVGYRVKELLFGQSNEAVGRTNSVQGSIVLAGTTVTTGSFTADLTSVTSGQDRRDRQFQGRIIETAAYPTATFRLTKPVQLGSIPANGVRRSAEATGALTLHGVTRAVTFTVTGRRSGDTVQVTGSIPVTFADYNIQNPSFGPAQTEDHGTLEFLLVLSKHA